MAALLLFLENFRYRWVEWRERKPADYMGRS